MQTEYEHFLSQQLSNANRERLIRNSFIELHEKLFRLEEKINTLTKCSITLDVYRVFEEKEDPKDRNKSSYTLEWVKKNNSIKILK